MVRPFGALAAVLRARESAAIDAKHLPERLTHDSVAFAGDCLHPSTVIHREASLLIGELARVEHELQVARQSRDAAESARDRAEVSRDVAEQGGAAARGQLALLEEEVAFLREHVRTSRAYLADLMERERADPQQALELRPEFGMLSGRPAQRRHA